MHRTIVGVDVADGNKVPRLTICLKTFTNIDPVARRQRFAITTNFFRVWRSTIDWYDRDIANVTAALGLAMCGLLRSAEFCPNKSNWASLPNRLARSGVVFYPNLIDATF